MRILLDTNLLVRAAITPAGSARAILRLIEESEEHALVISAYLLSEVADVLCRDRIRSRWPLTDEEVRSYCEFLARIGEEVPALPLPPVIEDPKDQAIIEAAVAGTAAVICTFDAHFYRQPVLAFLCHTRYPGHERFRSPAVSAPRHLTEPNAPSHSGYGIRKMTSEEQMIVESVHRPPQE